MLVLSLKKNEKISIGRDIVLSVAEIKSGRIKLCIEAPRELEVRRAAPAKPEIMPDKQDDQALKRSLSQKTVDKARLK